MPLLRARQTPVKPAQLGIPQVRGEKPSPLVDIYSFGVLLFELVTGIRRSKVGR